MAYNVNETAKFARIAIVSIFLAAAGAVGEIVQPFQMRDNTIHYGVYLHNTKNTFIIALPDRIALLRRKDVQIPGNFSREAQAVNQVLSIIEEKIGTDEFDRVERNLIPLDAAIAGFEKMARPFLETTAPTTHRRQECLQQAIQYYTHLRVEIPQTVKVLNLHDYIERLHVAVLNDRKAINNQLLGELILLQSDINSVGSIAPTYEGKIQAVNRTLAALQSICLTFLRTAAVDNLAATGHTTKCRNLMKTLAQGVGIDAAYAAEFTRLADGVIAAAGKAPARFPHIIDSMQSIGADFEAAQRRYTAAVFAARAVRSLLRELADKAFGFGADALKTRILKRTEAIDQAIADGADRRDRINQLRQDFRQAGVALKRNDFQGAIRIYRSVSESKIAAGGLLAKAREGMVHAQGNQIMLDLEDPTKMDLAAIGKLVEAAESFLAVNGDMLKNSGFGVSAFQNEMNRLQNYADFKKNFERLAASLDRSPVRAWMAKGRIAKWLQDKQAEINPIAFKEWDAFISSREESLFTNVVARFFDQRTTLDRKAVMVYRSLVDHCLADNRFAKVAGMCDTVYAYNEAISEAAVVIEMAKIEELLAEAYADAGKFETAMQIFDRISGRYPEYATSSVLKDNIASLLHLISLELIDTGKTDGAIELLDLICHKYPGYAQRKKIHRVVVELRLDSAPEARGDRKSRLRFYDSLATRYAAHVSEVTDFKAIRAGVAKSFRTSWQGGNYMEALVDIYDFQSTYPSLSREMKIEKAFVPSVTQYMAGIEKERSMTKKPVASAIADALRLLNQRYPEISRRHKFNELFVKWKLQRADEYVKTGQIVAALEVCQDLIVNFPEQAEAHGVAQQMKIIGWKYKLERIQRPLGINESVDWSVFVLCLILWPIFGIRSLQRGRMRGHMRYRVLQFITSLVIFLALLGCFLYGKYPFAHAFAFAFLVPEAVYHVLGFPTLYLFFPLIYGERRLNLQRGVLRVLGVDSGGDYDDESEKGNAFIRYLRNTSSRLERDLPLLHDRMLYRIEKAREIATARPEQGYAIFQRLLRRLNQGLGKFVDHDAWNEHHAACLFNLGVLARELNRKAEARTFLNEHVKLRPKSAESRRILGEILFEQGDHEGAITHIKICLAAHGGDNKLWYSLGRCYFELGDNASASKCFESVSEESRDVLFFGARAYSRANELDKAVEQFQLLLKRYPKDTESIYYLASSLAQHGETQKAAKIAGLIKPEDPFYPGALTIVGNILFVNKDLDNARAKFNEALAMDAKCIPALLGLALLNLEDEERDKSRKLFEFVCELNAENPTANYYLGKLYEADDSVKAIFHFERATQSVAFKAKAQLELGRISFFRRLYDKSIHHFELAGNADGTAASTWYLYLFAYALASQGRFERFEQILARILGRSYQEESWLGTAPTAVYALGTLLMEKNAYTAAHKCFDFVRSSVTDEPVRAHLDKLLEELSLRILVDLLAGGASEEALCDAMELQAKVDDEPRQVACQFYQALAHIHLEQYKEADTILSFLSKKAPDNARFLYHRAFVKLGQGDGAGANSLLERLEQLPDPPHHIRAGIGTIKAYLFGIQENYPEAISALDEIRSAPVKGAANGEYLDHTLRLTRVFYQCHQRESRHARDELAQLPERLQPIAAYLYAAAAVEDEELGTALDLLRPFANASEENRKLFTILATEHGVAAVAARDRAAARRIFEEIPVPPPMIEDVILSLSLSDVFDRLNDAATVAQTIHDLLDRLPKVHDRYMIHSVMHNLAVLHLKYCILMEEAGEKENIYEIWDGCITFWTENIFDKPEFWNLELERFSSSSQPLRMFTVEDLEAINLEFQEDNFVELFVVYILSYLNAGDERNCGRHMSLLQLMGERTGNLTAYVNILAQAVTTFNAGIDKADPRHEIWDFAIANLLVQIKVGEILGRETEALKLDLEIDRLACHQYDSPREFERAKREFNTIMLDALQQGALGSFAAAGDQLEKILKEVPPGIDLGKHNRALRRLCKAARQPKQTAQKGVDLNSAFDKMYTAVRNHNMRKSSDNAGPTRKKTSVQEEVYLNLR